MQVLTHIISLTAEIGTWVSNYMSFETTDVDIHPCRNSSSALLVKWYPVLPFTNMV